MPGFRLEDEPNGTLLHLRRIPPYSVHDSILSQNGASDKPGAVQFIERRRSGAIDARGNPVSKEHRRPVRTRTIEVDLRFLLAALRWGTTWGVGEGNNLLSPGAVPAYDIPTEKNPRRAVATQDRLERTMEVAADVHPYLPTLLALANGTGRRIGAIRQLQYSDLLADHGWYGHLRFRADSDKMGFDSTFPLTRELRRVVDRHVLAHSGIGDAPMFAAPGDPSKPVTRYRVDRWLRVAERRAGLSLLPGRLWHAYRAKFATEMLDEPDRVVAALGGWKTPRTLDIYQQPDEGAMLRALERRRELRKLEN
jgi:integrase